MSATYCGLVTLGGALPGASAAVTAGAQGIDAAFPDISDRVAALQTQITALATMPPLPSFGDLLARAVDLSTALTLALATPGLPPPPTLATAIAELSALVASLLAMSADLASKLSLITSTQASLAAAGIHVVAFSGDASALGSEIQGALVGHVSGTANAVALVTTDSESWSAMGAVLKVSP